MNIINQNTPYIILVLLGASILLIIWNIILSMKLNKIKKRFNRFTRGGQIHNLEQAIIKYSEETESMKTTIEKSEEQIKKIVEKIKWMKGRVGVVRYNAFGEEGNDLSFSVAFLDDNENGIVLTSIYNRGQSNTYAKPLSKGNSNYKLSSDELIAIEEAKKP